MLQQIVDSSAVIRLVILKALNHVGLRVAKLRHLVHKFIFSKIVKEMFTYHEFLVEVFDDLFLLSHFFESLNGIQHV
jgi:hypothetical protein